MSDESSSISMPEPGWTIYRITTESTSYHLSIYAGGKGRSVAVLHGTSRDRPIDEADRAPLVGDRSLFYTDPSSWVGDSLELGNVTTSAIVGVERETNAMVVRAVTHAAAVTMAGGGNKRITVENIAGETDVPHRIIPADFPYPEDNVIRLESAAHFLGAVCDRTSLVDDLASFPALRERFEEALTECLLRVSALGERARERD